MFGCYFLLIQNHTYFFLSDMHSFLPLQETRLIELKKPHVLSDYFSMVLLSLFLYTT